MNIDPQLVQVICAVVSLMGIGSTVRLIAVRNADSDVRKSRLGSLRTWWVLVLLISCVALFGQYGVTVVLIVAGIMGLREYLRLIGFSGIGPVATTLAFTLIPLHYALILSVSDTFGRLATPALVLVSLGTSRVLTGRVEMYIRTTGAMVWGVLLFGYSIAHALLVMRMPLNGQPAVGTVGWFLFLVMLTESNDICQAIIGRRFGRHRITPVVSPNKSWEGFAGGIIMTTLLAIVLAPWLTTFHAGELNASGFVVSCAAGLIIAGFGFLGDINMSAIKRDAGVKDGSSILPGQGGIIDRIDSLTFTAPAFFYFVLLVNS